MITAKDEDADRILGLDIGADDYIVKPFSPGEVMARIRAVRGVFRRRRKRKRWSLANCRFICRRFPSRCRAIN